MRIFDLGAAFLVATVCAGVAAPLAAQVAPDAARRPTLVVMLTIDQFRAEYLERYGALPGGLGRLARGGATFTDAHHDHAITETAPGHATLLSGRFPRSTGIMMNRVGVEDAASPLLEDAAGAGASPRRFVGTALADWLRAADARSRALSVSMKDRGAILPIGRSTSDVYWYSPDGRFTTSRYYRDTLPQWVQSFNGRHLPQAYAGHAWRLLLPESVYSEADSVPVEAAGVDIAFPHVLPADSAGAASLVRITPFSDDLVVALALQGVQSLNLGIGPQPDLLAVSLSATDYIGHRYGPDSREMHDQILRLDRTVGMLLDSLYRLRDSSRIVVALSADHGVARIPELAVAADGSSHLRVNLGEAVDALRAGLRAARLDTLAVDLDQQIVLVNRAEFRRGGVDADSTVSAFARALRAVSGVQRVDRFGALAADTLRDPIARRWSHQFPANAPVELVITLAPGNTWGGNVASHGSPYDYDSHVPLVFFGAGVKPGQHAGFVRTVDLAPTLAALAGVAPAERLDGVVLREALLAPH